MTTFNQSQITIALSKGRILAETCPLLSAMGVDIPQSALASRQLRIASACGQYAFLVLRATDVPVFVSHGAADVGVVGKDVLLEQRPVDVYELLDLGIACCRLMVAEPIQQRPQINWVKRVATKYVNVANDYFAAQSEQIELIKLYGSMELAPMVGLADVIVDVVDTGKTLKANGLQPTELIADISSRLIVNKSAMKRKYALIQPLLDGLGQSLG